jgi:hypothetical protein
MIHSAVKRSLLRWVHLVLTIPVLGYVYGPPAEVKQYAVAVRIIFVPVILLTGYWMYAGAYFAILGVAVWLSAVQFFGPGTAILSQVVLLVARKIWLVVRARKAAANTN